MRILHFINSLGTGGAERLVVDLAEAGQRHGHDVRILTISDRPGLPRDYAHDHGLNVSSLGLGRRDPRVIGHLRRECARVDILHSHLFPAMYWGALIQSPKIFTEHSTRNRRMDNPMFGILERPVYKSYDKVVAIGEGVADSLRDHFGRLDLSPDMAIVTNGIRGEFVRQGFVRKPRVSPDQPLRIVSVCSLTTVKNLPLAIRAVAQLPYATLDIAGEGPLRGELESLIRELRVEDRIRLLGPVVDVATLLVGADLFLSTSRWEGFALSLAEALSSGLPVVGPRVPGVSEVVTDGRDGVLFASGSDDAAVRAIVHASSPDVYSELSASAITGSPRFSIDSCFSAYESLYEEILGSQSSVKTNLARPEGSD